MSQLISKPFPLDLSLGFSWNALVKIPSNKKRNNDTVIYELQQENGIIKISVCLIAQNLSVKIIDNKGKEFLMDPVNSQLFVDKAVYVEVGIQKISNGFKGEIWVNKIVASSREFDLAIGSGELHYMQSIGSDAKGRKAATFTMGELIIYNKYLETPEREQLYVYFRDKWDLEGNNI